MHDDIIPDVLTDLNVISSYADLQAAPAAHSHTHTCNVLGVIDADTDTAE
ncbi:MAG: hypothetical protein GXP47_01085 [Acidobacteria bacterium]|nr:hypothetical protein [Acidobacteriota bacterium]